MNSGTFIFPGLEDKNTHTPLSGEDVVSSYSVIATGPVSRHRVEFVTLRACRLCELEGVGFAILGALKCLQTGRARLRRHFEGARRAREPWGASRHAPELFEGGVARAQARFSFLARQARELAGIEAGDRDLPGIEAGNCSGVCWKSSSGVCWESGSGVCCESGSRAVT